MSNPQFKPLGVLAVMCLTVLSACNPPRVEPSLTYQNPLKVEIGNGKTVDTCADPAIIQGQKAGDSKWYIFCTTDPLNSTDRNDQGGFNFHQIPILVSDDLVNWTYKGDAFQAKPDWVKSDAGLWAPDIEYINGKYMLYYTASDTVAGGSAIGVATSDNPLGPWVDSGKPVVEPDRPPNCCENDKRWTFDPDVIRDDAGQLWIYYGSYFGGLSVRKLSADGLTSDKTSQKEIAIANRYEGAQVVKKGEYYYLIASASACCNGPLTGYSLFVGRSKSPTGPFVDQSGVDLNATNVGGTPFLAQNGNRWVGVGHNAIFTDASGQDWTVYHGVDQETPFLNTDNFTRRPVLMDPVDWANGWPVVRGGNGPSDEKMPAPAAQKGQKNHYQPEWVKPLDSGAAIAAATDEFAGNLAGWSWTREPAAAEFGIENGTLRMNVQHADLHTDSNNAAILSKAAPTGNYVVETKVKINFPADGCCFNYTQAGLVVFSDDNNFVKLVHFSNWETRQIEFAKEVGNVPANFPRYGNLVMGPPSRADQYTYLRIVKHTEGGHDLYTGFTSLDGVNWTRGGTWEHTLGGNARIGLVAMGTTDGNQHWIANFDYVRTYQLK
ncbi:family 43 glycosylhydrolase [Deinococcus cellulosilyticus]|uniref:Beta-xylosidase C-terminal Concanavalin A-like domain-containing protein n=1 Tax=Deinococcus cellulosilyticus (strain DSM 18568 / NBRC 106333 / KACC 11606 / 5516J-15) TaxID=1223518 RepID=A0A511N0L1_DEIC1|nr:family 43 glycosylhydrolase [Deinococcus cellulosilyticus]GEM46031.1 hypothetical protein DC3_16660 [Deinococcus cellulosilyticus NBRC 106333 = KACC 11606]